jgi:hypothetical protein
MNMNSPAAIEKGGRSRMKAIGKKRWAIPEGYIPSESVSTDRALISHETACILNAGDDDAHITLTIFFTNREPVNYMLTVAARRTLHLRFNDLKDPEPFLSIPTIPRCLNPTCRSPSSIRGSTRGAPKSRCSPPSPMPKID